MILPTRCILCGRDDEKLRDLIFVEPTDGEDSSPKYRRGFMCLDCEVIHWAWEDEANARF